MNRRLLAQEVTLEVSDQVEGNAILVIHEGLNQFNIEAFPEGRSQPWALLLRDAGGALRGGLHAITYTGASMIVALWVEPVLRGKGWGSALVEAAAIQAARSGARVIFAEPASFQAAAFWKKVGFACFGRLEGLANGAALLEVGRWVDGLPAQPPRPPDADGFSIALDTLPRPADIEIIRNGVQEGAAQAGWVDDFRRIVITARTPAGEVIGGLIGASHWCSLHVETLWVHEEWRGLGLGRRILAAAESQAPARACGVVYLETTSFQARPFYEKVGYTLTWEMDAEPGKLQIFGMHRYLSGAPAESAIP